MLIRIKPPKIPIRKITKGAFYERFTPAELVSLESSSDPLIAVYKSRMNYRSHVNLDFKETIDGLDYLISSEDFPDFNEARKAEMLKDGTIGEKYTGA